MFTGLVQGVGTVARFDQGRLAVKYPSTLWPDEPLQLGESVAVNGCCLTVIEDLDGVMQFDLSEETIRRTAFAETAVGSRVNLERALKLGDRLGGHVVQGHVDGVGELVGIQSMEHAQVLRFRVPDGGEKYLIDKGSIALHGVSLTVVSPQGAEFECWIIPHTWNETSLGQLSQGQKVNIEYDVLAKHVEKLLSLRH